MSAIRSWRIVGLTAALLATATGCSTREISALPAPGASFAGRTTFRIGEEPVEARAVRTISLEDRNVEAVVVESTDAPMLNNAIISDIVENDIRQAFEMRGYSVANRDPDFEVGFYVQAKEKIDLDDCRGGPYYYGYGYRGCDLDEFTEGTVVIDVRDPDTDKLLWRGTGVARVSDNPQKYAKQVRKVVNEIISRFPAANYASPRATTPAGDPT